MEKMEKMMEIMNPSKVKMEKKMEMTISTKEKMEKMEKTIMIMIFVKFYLNSYSAKTKQCLSDRSY
jgi:hypothetical protein